MSFYRPPLAAIGEAPAQYPVSGEQRGAGHGSEHGSPARVDGEGTRVVTAGQLQTGERDEGTIAATCREMSDEEAREIAEGLFGVFNDVCKMYGVEEARKDGRLK